MDYSSHPDSSGDLAARLALKTGLSEAQAQSFLDALSNLKREDEQGGHLLEDSPQDLPIGSYPVSSFFSPAHAIRFPLVEQPDGTMTVDASSYSAWSALPRPQTLPTVPANPEQPKSPQEKPRTNPPKRPPGAYPGPSVLFDPLSERLAEGVYDAAIKGGGYGGPSVFISLHDPLGSNLDLAKVDLQGLSEALAKAKSASIPESLKPLQFGDYEEMEEK